MSLLGLPISIGFNALFSALVHWAADGAQAILRDVIGSAITGSTKVDLGQNSWFGSATHSMFGVEALIMAPLLFAATIGAILRQDMRRLVRAWGVCLPLSMLAGYAVVALTNIGLNVTDAISTAIQYEVMPNMGAVLVRAISLGLTAMLTQGALAFALSLLIIAGCLAIWLELVVRSAAIELAVFFMPLALAGLVWPATAHWAKRLGEVLVALLLMKPVIVGALCLGAGAVLSMDNTSTVVTGLAILLIAAFAPYALLKLVPMVGVAAIAHLEGLSRQPFRAAERIAPRALALYGNLRAPSLAGPVAGHGGDGVDALSGGVGQMLSQVGDDGPVANPYGPAGDPEVVRAQRA